MVSVATGCLDNSVLTL